MISNSTSMIIPAVDVAELVAEILFKSNDLPKVEEEIFKSLTFSCEPIYIEGGEIGFRVDDVKALVKNFVQAVRGNDSSCLRQMRGICVERIVGVQEFVESREFMVQRDFCRPAVMEGLIELFDSTRSEAYIECVLTGSVGWGKTYFGYLAVAYMLYKLSCFYNPQIEYDNAPGTSIVFIQQSKKLELARKVVFEQFAEMIKRSPYFMTIFPFDPKVRSELRFPKNIFVLPVGGQDTAAIGMNVYGGVIDEMNFMARIRESERFLGGGVKKGSYDQAERV